MKRIADIQFVNSDVYVRFTDDSEASIKYSFQTGTYTTFKNGRIDRARLTFRNACKRIGVTYDEVVA